MNYEVKNVNPGRAIENDDNTITQEAVVVSGIVDDIYGFNRWDNVKITVPMTYTADQIKAELLKAAQDLVEDKYPNK